jgi:serine/threonine-protein kinase RsbW
MEPVWYAPSGGEPCASSMTEGLPAPLRLRLASHLELVRPIRKMIEALLAGQGWEEDAVEDAALVVTEVVQNAVEHGSKHDGSEWIELEVELLPGALLLSATDPGTGRSVAEFLARDVAAPPDLESPRGRGLYLIHRMSARFERVRLGDGGCRVRVRITCGGDA